MSEDKDVLLREKGFGFFGAITASLSHQMNNVLATINELSGLLDDFLLAAQQGKELDPEHLRTATKRIANQVERGQDYVKRLNRFAHTVDDPLAPIQVRDSLEALNLLCRRFATLKKSSLELDLGDTSPVLEGWVFDFQHVVYRCLRMVINAAGDGDTIGVRLAPRTEGARVVVTSAGLCSGDIPTPSEIGFLRLLVAELRGQIAITFARDAPPEVVLTLPRCLRTQESMNGETTNG